MITNMITISVPPMVEVEREVVKARIGGNATLKCKSQAFPPSENFWTLTSHEPISSGEVSNWVIQASPIVTNVFTAFLPGGRLKVEIWLADQQSQTQLNIVGVTREDLRSVSLLSLSYYYYHVII